MRILAATFRADLSATVAAGQPPEPHASFLDRDERSCGQVIRARVHHAQDELSKFLAAQALDPDADHRRLRRTSHGHQAMEIRVQDHDHSIFRPGMLEDHGVVCRPQSDVAGVNGIEAIPAQMNGRRSRQTLIEQDSPAHGATGKGTTRSSRQAAA
jgi:hypothetical protein